MFQLKLMTHRVYLELDYKSKTFSSLCLQTPKTYKKIHPHKAQFKHLVNNLYVNHKSFPYPSIRPIFPHIHPKQLATSLLARPCNKYNPLVRPTYRNARCSTLNETSRCLHIPNNSIRFSFLSK